MSYRSTRAVSRPCLAACLAACLAGCLAACAEPPGASRASSRQAPRELLRVEGRGTWADEDRGGLIRAWVDARVANRRYDKRVFVEVLARYEGGAEMRTLHVASHRGALSGGDERWGTDGIELYPSGGPYGARLAGPVLFRLRSQDDLEDDGVDEMLLTDWEVLFGEGEPTLPAPETDPWREVRSEVRGGDDAGWDVRFAPFEDPGALVIEQIDRVLEAQRAAPTERHTLHAAVFNVTDEAIVERLLEAHRAGVEVRLLIDGRKFRPWYDWHRGDDRLLAAGVPVLGVRRPGSGAMHDKIALFDGRRVATGSFNWETGARFENHENIVTSGDPELLRAYAARFEALAGGVRSARLEASDPEADVSVSFAPDEAPARIVGELIDRARRSVHLAMFTAKDIPYTDREGRPTSLLARLVEAHRRGVEVTVVVDSGIHEASEYHGRLTEDDPSDEALEAEGIRVVRADNPLGPYASMHHKYLVIDGETVVTGAFNWYWDAAYANDEDQLVVRDPDLAARFEADFVDLQWRYDPAFDPEAHPAATVVVEARCEGTGWGDRLVLVGEDPALGGWDPSRGVELDGSSWPTWRGSFVIPRGARSRYKLVLLRADGRVEWEAGEDRRLEGTEGAIAPIWRS